jgi:hypothetical protein
VSFLLQPTALEPYRLRAAEHQAAAEKVAKAAEGRKIEKPSRPKAASWSC